MFYRNFMKKIKQKGVSMVEYAVLLAFVAVVAGVFMDDGGLKGGIQGSVDKVVRLFYKDEINAELEGVAVLHSSGTLWVAVGSKSGDKIYSDKYNSGNALSNWTYDSVNGYTAWTNADIKNMNVGTSVNVIVYRNLSTYENRKGDEFYIGTAKVDSNHHLSNVEYDSSKKYTDSNSALNNLK